MRKLILTLAVLVLTVQAAFAQTTQPAPPPPQVITKDTQDDSVQAEKKRIQDRWSSMPGTTSSTKAAKPNTPGQKPAPAKTNTP